MSTVTAYDLYICLYEHLRFTKTNTLSFLFDGPDGLLEYQASTYSNGCREVKEAKIPSEIRDKAFFDTTTGRPQRTWLSAISYSKATFYKNVEDSIRRVDNAYIPEFLHKLKIFAANSNLSTTCIDGKSDREACVTLFFNLFMHSIGEKIDFLPSEKPPVPSPNLPSDKSTPVFKIITDLDISPEEVAKQLLANDEKLYGDIGPHMGSIKQLSELMTKYPENWGLLVVGETRLVGNWSIGFLSPEQEYDIRHERLNGKDFTVANSDGPLSEGAIYLMNMSINPDFQTTSNWVLLWESLVDRLYALAKSGCYYRGIYVTLFREDQYSEFERQYKFDFVSNRPFKGKIYYHDLMQSFPAIFKRSPRGKELAPLYEEYWRASISFRQLSHNEIDSLSDKQLEDISKLIFDTDKYIYPAMFTKEQAKHLLPHLFASNNDPMFSLDNLFVAFAGERIIGIILWKRGPLKWTKSNLVKKAEFLGEKLPDSLGKTESEYFTSYDDVEEDSTSIINVCVHSNWRSHNLRVGTNMLAEFVKAHPERLALYVLRETEAALRIYERNGFELKLEATCNGFSVDDRELPCGFMVRAAEKKPAHK